MALKTLALRKFVFQNAVNTFYTVTMDMTSGTAKVRKLGKFMRPYRPTDTVTTVNFDADQAKQYTTRALDTRPMWGATTNSTLGSLFSS